MIVFINPALLDHLVPPSRPGDPLRETLVSTEGREIPVHGMKPVFGTEFARAIPGMPASVPVVARQVAAHGDYQAIHPDSVLIKVDVPGMPVSLVTAVSGREAYGDATPRLFLYCAAAFPLLVLVLARSSINRSDARAGSGRRLPTATGVALNCRDATSNSPPRSVVASRWNSNSRSTRTTSRNWSPSAPPNSRAC